MNKRYMTKLALPIFFIGVLTTLSGYAASKVEVQNSQSNPNWIAGPLTKDNSVLGDFGNGLVLRIPTVLADTTRGLSGSGTYKMISLQMTFIYPDMVLSNWVPWQSTVMEKEANKYVPQKDRFTVFITEMVYWPSFHETRPSQMLRNMHSDVWPPKLKKSAFKGLYSVNFPNAAKVYPELQGKPSYGGTYVTDENGPYDVLLDCDSPAGIKCRGDVYDKNNGFDYDMVFPPEAVSHAYDLITAIDSMIARWEMK